MSETIDAHHHLWEMGRFDMSWLNTAPLLPLRRNFLPDDLRPQLDEAGVDRTVVVQTQHHLDETRWFLALADQDDRLAGVVGWVDLTSDACEQQLEEIREHPKLVGIRHVTHDEPEDDFIVREDVLRGLKVLEKHRVPFDLLFFPRHLHHATTLAEHLPDLPLVLDHLAKPPIKEQRLGGWREAFRSAAQYPNVFCKLSGMITEAAWTSWKPSDLKPYVEVAMECFGPDRLLFGSDWPVCTLAGRYQQVVDALNEALGPIGEEERNKIFGETAKRFYGI